MNKTQKSEVIEVLKDKFSQYNNFYITNTESLTVAQVNKLRNVCFDKNVEMKVAKNTLIKKALESLDAEKYSGIYEALHQVTALMFSENPKEPALILSGFRTESKKDKPVLKAAFINGEVYLGDGQLTALTKIKTKNELIGELIGLLQSPAQRVIAALLNGKGETADAPVEVAAATVAETPVAEAPAAPVVEVTAVPVVEVTAVPVVEVIAVPVAEAPSAAVIEATAAAEVEATAAAVVEATAAPEAPTENAL